MSTVQMQATSDDGGKKTTARTAHVRVIEPELQEFLDPEEAKALREVGRNGQREFPFGFCRFVGGFQRNNCRRSAERLGNSQAKSLVLVGVAISLKTGSLWLGYNFSVGKKLILEATPMIGGVFGDITGIAPGYAISISYEPIEFFTQGEYFFDSAIHAGDFLYTWSELSYAPASWCKVGVVVDRTKALGSSIDIRRGPLVGFKYKKVDFTTYRLSPGTRDGTFIFAVTVNF